MCALLVGLLILSPPNSMAVPKTQGLTSAVSVPVAPGTTTGNQPFGGGSFVGTLTITGFQVVNGALNAVGTVTGNLLDSAGNQVGSTITQAVSIPVAASGSCPILNLTLGPLDLNVLGLVVHLNQVVLNITAVPGAGNLLGNLLCSVANLLNGGSPLSTLATNLAALLNQVLAAL